MSTIKDVYIGKPDARDEILFDGYEKFMQSFVIPPNFDTDELLCNDKCFIRGYKGTGKTALLIYLQELLLKKDPGAFTSFLLFKDQYRANQRKELNAISAKIVRSIDASEVISNEQDYEYIWRWIFLKQIVEDNESCDYNLFENDNNWELFSKTVKRILIENKKDTVFKIPRKVKIGVDYSVDTIGTATYAPNIEVDFESKDNIKPYAQFIKQIDLAIDYLCRLVRTDIPYFTFIDELEAYYTDEILMKRDLQLIRDMIITVKYFNQVFASCKYKQTKMIASIRTEIISSISRFISAKEINKTTAGFEIPVVWDYNNTNSYAHPILQIWIRRIQLSLPEASNLAVDEVYKKWFPELIDNVEPANYILNNSWSKPRDIVRFLTAAKNCLNSSQSAYTSAVFSSLMKEYSIESRKEIVEEMNALYTAEQIDTIFSCLRGYKSTFSYEELEERVKKYYSSTILCEKLLIIVKDLYRLGIIGNYSTYSKQHRWQHKGDDGVLFSDDWKLFVHRALQKDLSINSRRDKSLKYISTLPTVSSELAVGMEVEFTVRKILPALAIGIFTVNGREHEGTIHISQIAYAFVNDINDYLAVGQTITAKIIEQGKRQNSWRLTLK